jgi:DMSO/TMAO reductase YedYZ molybdopterin-dependent catalytic subunit
LAFITRRYSPVELTGGALAALVASLLMWLVRSTLQVRSIPERLFEWLLLFVPLDVFEAGLQQFGFSAKRYALYLAILVMLVSLAWVGAEVLRRAWPIVGLMSIGIGLWLFTMLVIMPLTSAGVFATALLEGARNTILSYLAVGLVFSAVLVMFRVFLLEDPATSTSALWLPATDAMPPRRWALSVAGSSAALIGVTYVLDALFPYRTGLPTIVVADPQEPVPSGGIDEPNPHPNAVPSTVPQAAAAPNSTPAPAATPAPTRAGMPEPPPARTLARDQDGAVLPSGRRPGDLPDLVTSNENFYIVTKNAAGDPVLHPEDWRLVVDGEVQRPFELDYTALRKLPAVEITKSLECISNLVDKCQLAPFGCDLISTARWRGVRLADILGLVGGVKPGADWVATISADEYTTALPLEVAMSPDALLVFEMNGEVLPREHGYPARVLVPGRYGMKNAKWVVALRPMRREFVDWYGMRQWSREAVIKTMTRIDIPARDARLQGGAQRIAGIAYAGDRGIQQVEYSTDGGDTWQKAELVENALGPDTWVRWQGRFTIGGSQDMTLMARATDGTGALQIQPFSLAQPDGAAGWNSIAVKGA